MDPKFRRNGRAKNVNTGFTRVLQKGVIKRDHAIMESDEESRGREKGSPKRGGMLVKCRERRAQSEIETYAKRDVRTNQNIEK
jgi:hypothetical protein